MDPTTFTVDSATIMAAGDSHSITVTCDADKVEYTLPNNGSYTEEESPTEENYTFTITAKATYQIDSVKYKVGIDGEEKTLEGAEGEYSIPKSEITADVTITVAASKIQYTVTPAVTMDGKVVTDFEQDATVTFSTTATENKVEAGGSLTINASLKDAAKATHKITKVAYKMGDAEEVDLTETWNGTTTISNVSGNVAITVTVVALETYKVSFGEHTNIAKVTEIKINDAAANPAELNGETEGAWEISVTEGSKVSFKLEPAEKFAIGDVTAGETKLTPVTGVYTIESVTAATTVAVETALDRTQVGRFTFDIAEGSDKKTATMTVAVPAGATDNDNTAGSYEAGSEEKLTRLEKIFVSFAAADGYKLGEVKVNGTAVTATTEAAGETPAQYEVALAVNTDTKITVATEAAGTTTEKHFAINNNASHMALGAVKADADTITPVTEEGANKGKYPVAVGKKRVTFSLAADGAYEPVVTAVTKATEEGGNDTTEVVEANEVKTVSGKTTYSYMILASALADEYNITEKQAKKAISFTGTENVDVSIDGKLTNVSSAIEYVQGRKLTVKVAAKDNVTLNSVSYKVGEANEVTPRVANNASEFQVTLTEDTVVTIDAVGARMALPLKDADGEELTPVRNVYNVSYDGTYTAEIVEGTAKTIVEPTEAKLFNGNTEIVAADSKPAVVAIKDKKVELNLGNADVTAVSNKKLTLKVTVGADAAAETFAYTLQVSKAIAAAGDITVPASVSQPTDTAKTYVIKTKGELAKLQVKVNETDISAGYLADQPTLNTKNGNLVIIAGKTPTPAEGIKITVSAGEGNDAISKEMVLKTTALISESTAAPKVTLKSATDLGFTLAVSAKTDKDALTNSLYYKVTATPGTGLTADDKLKSDATVMYVVKDGDAQDIPVDLKADGAQAGNGKAWKYKVSVSLVQAKSNDGTKPDDSNNKPVAEGKAFTTPDNKPFATQDPAWEANLKLKKGKTTIYTGEEDVAIATPQFTKTTTYTEIQAGNISDLTFKNGEALTFSVENGIIKASASSTTAVGKHTVEVKAVADGTKAMAASKATIVVNVVKGINTLEVSVPTTSLYKAVNKAATLKATPIYNDDETGKDKTKQPKTKKVKWDVVAYAADHSNPANDTIFASGKVTIKNGTVTVAKDYVIQADPDANKFQIRATVDNDKAVIGDAPAAYSEAIEITNEGLDMNRLVLVDSDDKVLAISSESKPRTEEKVEAAALNSASVKIVDAAATVAVGDTYSVTTANEISSDNLTYKSSKPKDVSFGSDGAPVNQLAVTKANTKPTLTVTANDGSKATLGIKLNVDYDTPTGDLALQIMGSTDTPDTPIYDPTTDGDTTTKTYKGSATNILAAILMQKNAQGNWVKATDYVNYDVKVVSGGKKVTQEGRFTGITTDKAEVKIQLTDKKANKPTTYTLTNTNFVSSGQRVRAKVIGSLRQSAKADEQDVKLELDIPADFATSFSGDGKTAAVEIGVDWSKATLKNGEDLNIFEESLDEMVYDITLEDFNATTKKATVALAFDYGSDFAGYNQKNYALKVSVGSKTGNAFTAAAPAVGATVKVEKTKKFTFKPTTSYTIATRDGGVAITGKASIPADDLQLTGLSLQNANFGGQANEFTKYFAIDANNKLKIANGITANELAELMKKENKNNLTGYLTYTATTDKSYYDLSTGTGTNTVKITVKLNDTKTVAKYTAVSAEITNKAGETATVEIQANKAAVKIKHAMFDTTSTNKTDACIDTEATAAAALVTAEGKLSLKLKEAAAATKKTIKATVYVIPEDSYYLSEFGEGKTPTFDTYKQYGAAVTITLKMVQPKTMTLAEAKTAVAEWVDSVKTAETAPEWLTNKEATEHR